MPTTPNGFPHRAEAGPTPLVGFRLRRSNATLLGHSPGVDERVEAELTHLDGLLGRQIVGGEDHLATLTDWARRPLTPRRHKGATWSDGSLGEVLAMNKPGKDDETIADVLDRDPELARIRYAVTQALADRANELDLAQRTVLDKVGIRDLLIARAALDKGITDVTAATNYILTSRKGVAEFADAALIGAARAWVKERGLNVADISEDAGETVKALRRAGLTMSEDAFEPLVEQLIEGRIENQKHDALIEEANVSWLTPAIRARLYERIEKSPIPVTSENAAQLIPLYAIQAAAAGGGEPGAGEAGTGSYDPFAVEFFVEDTNQLAISTAAVKCASQLYYVMTLGDELGVFDAVRYFTHRYLFQEGFAVEDRTLRRDLEDYVFNEQFTGYDEEAGEIRLMRVTQEAERRSFYRQVFDQGGSPLPDGSPANPDFAQLWKILMLESARFLERAQSSPNPATYVSRQNVMQAVEDLQYNLSTACVGMATVMTPLMYAELDFVVKRILGHQEVRKHLVPAGGSWWKVVERLAAAQGNRTRASILHNKARLGYSLIRAIAEYTPSRFEQDDVFSAFISDVDAFITTQSILQEESADDASDEAPGADDAPVGNGYGMRGFPGMPPVPGLPGGSGIPAMAGGPTPGSGSAGTDDWNF
jgi:hypothetical protein